MGEVLKRSGRLFFFDTGIRLVGTDHGACEHQVGGHRDTVPASIRLAGTDHGAREHKVFERRRWGSNPRPQA